MNSIESAFSSIIGKAAWGLVRTFGSAIIVEFGNKMPRLNSRKEHGESHLLIQGGAWRMSSRSRILVGSDDSAEIIDKVFQNTNLGNVSSINIDKKTLDISIYTRHHMIESFTTGVGSCSRDYWILYQGESDAWAVQPGPKLEFYRE